MAFMKANPNILSQYLHMHGITDSLVLRYPDDVHGPQSSQMGTQGQKPRYTEKVL